jgi:hypothetical protein
MHNIPNLQNNKIQHLIAFSGLIPTYSRMFQVWLSTVRTHPHLLAPPLIKWAVRRLGQCEATGSSAAQQLFVALSERTLADLYCSNWRLRLL